MAAVFEADMVDVAITENVDVHPFGEGVDDRGADAMQTRGGLIGFVGEFAAGMEAGINDLNGGKAGLLVDIDGDAAAIVFDGAGTIFMEGDRDPRAIAVGGFVDAVIDDFPDKMVKTATVGGADIHTRTLANTLQFGEQFDIIRVVLRG